MEIAKFWSPRKAGGLFPLAWGPGRQETVCRHLLVSCPHGRLLHGLAHLQGGDVSIRHPGVVRPAPVLHSLYRGQEGPAPVPGCRAFSLRLEEHVPVMDPVATWHLLKRLN